MRSLSLAAVLAIAACGGGTHSVAPDLLPPDVELKQIGVRSVGLSGGTLDATVAIRNPNSITIRGTGLRLALDVQGYRFGETEWTRGYELAADSVVTLTVPVSYEWKTVGLAARGVLGHGDVRYEISGRTYLLIAGETWRFPYSRQGSVPLVKVPG